MGQFSVHKNKNPKSRTRYPYLVDVQSPLLDALETRLVVPLVSLKAFSSKTMTTLTPAFEINQQAYVLLTPQMAGIPRKELGAEVADLSGRHSDIIAAIDFLVTGI